MAARRLSDEQILDILDRFDRGHRSKRIAALYGMSESYVRTLYRRFVGPIDKEPQVAKKPENRHGGMPRRWWERDLENSKIISHPLCESGKS